MKMKKKLWSEKKTTKREKKRKKSSDDDLYRFGSFYGLVWSFDSPKLFIKVYECVFEMNSMFWPHVGCELIYPMSLYKILACVY